MPRVFLFAFLLAAARFLAAQEPATVLHAAHLLDVERGTLVSPGEVLIQGERIVAMGAQVPHPGSARVLDLGPLTLMPGLIDAHVHLFLHPGAEDLQTVIESVPVRTILAELAAAADLQAGFTAERDMGTEGAGSADSAVRDAIDQGLIPGPRMRMSGNAISVTGGHEDALGYNPAAHVPGNADYADGADDLIRVMREQRKQGADFTKIYETGADRLVNGRLETHLNIRRRSCGRRSPRQSARGRAWACTARESPARRMPLLRALRPSTTPTS